MCSDYIFFNNIHIHNTVLIMQHFLLIMLLCCKVSSSQKENLEFISMTHERNNKKWKRKMLQKFTTISFYSFLHFLKPFFYFYIFHSFESLSSVSTIFTGISTFFLLFLVQYSLLCVVGEENLYESRNTTPCVGKGFNNTLRMLNSM